MSRMVGVITLAASALIFVSSASNAFMRQDINPLSPVPIPCDLYMKKKRELKEKDLVLPNSHMTDTLFQAKVQTMGIIENPIEWKTPEGKQTAEVVLLLKILEVLEGEFSDQEFNVVVDHKKLHEPARMPYRTKEGSIHYVMGYVRADGQNALHLMSGGIFNQIEAQRQHWLWEWISTWFSECKNLP